MPKISVIVPVYNSEKYLERCIESILNQSFDDFELILVDDGSKDNSGIICDEFESKDKRIKTIHKKNAGVSAARNTGIDAAVGKYIMFVDSDDYIDNDMLELMYKENGADLVVSGLKYVTEDETLIKALTFEEFDNVSVGSFIKEHYIEIDKKLLLSGPINKLLKRSIIVESGIHFDDKLSICEDGLFISEFMRRCNSITIIKKSFYNYVQYNNGSLMSRYNDNAMEALEIFYRSKITLTAEFDENGKIAEYIKNDTVNRFMEFFRQIYTRSSLDFSGKYNKCKEVLQIPVFKEILSSNSMSFNLQRQIVKFAFVNRKSVFVAHCIFYFKFR